MLRISAIVIVLIVALFGLNVPAARGASIQVLPRDSGYLLIGGQNGTWFESGQAPRLEKVDLFNFSVRTLVPAVGPGVVWTGGWNGSQWLISGFGVAGGPNGSNPYLYLYNGQTQIRGSSEEQYGAEASWRGGDVFATSSNGRDWLLSGLGSGILPSYSPSEVNHMSLATFDGNNFTDLSGELPEQMDAILYANAWNGKLWLIGGGYADNGVLYSYDGSTFQDLTPQLKRMVLTFGSIQSLSWNGNYWLIGGMNFLAKYDGKEFTDLTPKLISALGWTGTCCTSINAIAWNGQEWMMGGGAPIAQFLDSTAWLASYTSNNFVNLSPNLGPVSTEVNASSILTVTSTGDSWIIGGYANGHGMLYSDELSTFTNLSKLVSNFTYVNWVGAGAPRGHTVPHIIKKPILDFSIPWVILVIYEERLRDIQLLDSAP